MNYKEIFRDLSKEELENYDFKWNNNDHIKALEYYIKPEVKIIWKVIFTNKEYNKLGHLYILLKYKNKYILIQNYINTFKNLDILNGCNINEGYSYFIEETEYQIFNDLFELKNFVENNRVWETIKETNILDFINKRKVFLKFELLKNNNKTKTYNVLSIFGVKLGVIKWFTNWRKYTFFQMKIRYMIQIVLWR